MIPRSVTREAKLTTQALQQTTSRHLTMPSPSVNKSAPELVAPARSTPAGRLPLSFMDRALLVRMLVDLVLVFKQGAAPAAAIKEALSRALVEYYPVAGRIVGLSIGEAEVACTGDGVWFVEASADCTLEDVNNLERPLMLRKDELLPFAPPEVDEQELIFLTQVTEFPCGGFAVGIRFSHTVFDGVGAAQFLHAVAELARGHARLAVTPVWQRECIRLPRPPSSAAIPLASFRFATAVFDVSPDQIALIKNSVSLETGQKCSTFDAVTALTWQARTRAVALPPDSIAHLGFAANTRHLLRPPLQREGFYGNCVYPVGLRVRSERVASAAIGEVVGLVRSAKERLAVEFLGWIRGELEDACKPPVEYGTMVVSDWRRVGFAEVDYGWGDPIHVLPLNDDCNWIGSCIYVGRARSREGLRLMTRCVEHQHLDAFKHEMMKFVIN